MAVFPSIVFQLPYTAGRRFLTCKDKLESGQEYGYYFDPNPLHYWSLSFSALTDTELSTIQTFWDDMRGGWDSFSFIDPDTSITYTKCRFVDGTWSLTHRGPNEYSLTLSITEFR